jgi:hypothetical protein
MEKKSAPTAPARTAGLVDEMLDELASRGRGRSELLLPGGRRLGLCENEHSTVIRVRRSDGHVELTIEIGIHGPVVRVDAAALEVECAGNVSIDCESLDVRARRRIELACERGDVRIDAGDDVVVIGERIRLN